MMIFLSKDMENVITTTSQTIAKELLKDEKIVYLGFTKSDAGFCLEKASMPCKAWSGKEWIGKAES